MVSYRLIFPAMGEGVGLRSVDASNVAQALSLAHRHGNGRPAELWRGDKLVCHITEDSAAGYWQIS